jgi:hypothetical protein
MMKNQIPAFASFSKKWKLVYWDDRSMLFLKDIPENAELIKRYEYKVLIPIRAVFQQKDFENDVINSPEIMRKEMNRKLIEEPLGYFYTGMNANIKDVIKN